MKILSGHLTNTEKRHILYMIEKGITGAKINKFNYMLFKDESFYRVVIYKKDRGLIPCGGSELRVSKYTSTFTL